MGPASTHEAPSGELTVPLPLRGTASVGRDSFWIPVLLITGLAAALRFYAIGRQGFWFDEGNTALLVHVSPRRMLELIPHRESTPPLYYCVLWVWARLFGFGEAGLRSFSACVGSATVPMVMLAAQALSTRRAALITGLLAAANPLLIWYSQEARAYALLAFMSALTLLLFALARARPTARRCALWAAACVVALWTHYDAALVVAPEAGLLLWRHRRAAAGWWATGAVLIGGLAALRYAITQQGTGHTAWIHAEALSRRLGQVVPEFVAGFGGPANRVIEPLAVFLAVGAVVGLLAGARHEPLLSGARISLAIAAAGLGLSLVLVACGSDDLLTRNLLALWAPAAIGVAGGLSSSRLRRAGVLMTAALCAIGIAVAIDVDTNQALQRPDWRVVARALGGAPGGGRAGRLILIQHLRTLLPLSLYMPHLRALHGGGVSTSQVDIVTFTAPRTSGDCWWGAACNLWPSAAQPSYRIPGFRPVSRAHVHQFTVIRMDASTPRRVDAAELDRALETTRPASDEVLYQP